MSSAKPGVKRMSVTSAFTTEADAQLASAFRTRSLVNIADAYEDDRFNPEVDLKSGYRTKSVLCFPILNSKDEAVAM